MNAKEFRVGNHILVNFKKEIHQGIITSISDKRIVVDHKYSIKVRSYNYSGISLTTDWIEKHLVYKKGIVGFMDTNYPCYILSTRIKLWSIDGKTYIFQINAQDICEIKLVHTLQNLYYDLNETELPII